DRYWDAWAGKGRMEKELGQLSVAEKSYEKSITVYPGYENGYFGLGLVKESRRDLAGAAETYRRGLADNPGSLPLAFRLAVVETTLGRETAAADWARALQIAPGSPPTRAGYATWLLDQGRIDEARRQAREALRRDPAFVSALRTIAAADGRESRFFAEGLAREKVFRLTGAAEDRAELERVAQLDEGYRRRLGTLRETLDRPGRPSPQSSPR
ncbi:MAG TPA: tetratricopeptide repeat protein, partial [Thermoanaerobaculia bacterium]